jgi:hypothetical protein
VWNAQRWIAELHDAGPAPVAMLGMAMPVCVGDESPGDEGPEAKAEHRSTIRHDTQDLSNVGNDSVLEIPLAGAQPTQDNRTVERCDLP